MPSSFDLSPLECLLECQPGHKLWAVAENSSVDDGSYNGLRHQRTASGNLALQGNTDSVFGEGHFWPETAMDVCICRVQKRRREAQLRAEEAK